ncbi:MAG TPA: cyclic nucleotide-binding domain-containing protein [Anaerolineales bacterium]
MNDHAFIKLLLHAQQKNASSLPLEQGARVAVIGGGPAGSLFSFFLLDMAERIGLKIIVDIYEPRDFDLPGPSGCNMCGGVLYESLVQSLAVDGINLPETVVQRGIEFNMLHLDVGSVRIQTPRREKRIATTFRGIGPRGLMNFSGQSLDGYLLRLAVHKGARRIRNRVADVRRIASPESNNPQRELVQVKIPGGEFQDYELTAVATGVNTAILKLFREMDFGYKPPHTAKLLVREYYLGDEDISKYFGSAFHAFMLDIPGLDFGAIIPKGDYMTVCLLSSHKDLHPATLDVFLSHPSVRNLLPPDFPMEHFSCWCGPRINIMGSKQPFGDRIVFIGDSGVSRLYKDGIGAAYRAAKAAARTAIFQGVSAKDFKRYYLPFCRKMETDNHIGRWLFMVVRQINKMQFARRAVLRMVSSEQQGNIESGMSMIMWDMLTGGAPYKDVLRRILRPVFQIRFLWNLILAVFSPNEASQIAETTMALNKNDNEDDLQTLEEDIMKSNTLGKIYQDGEVIFHKGDAGDSMFVIQEGMVEVVQELDGEEVYLAVKGPGEVIGEMAIFERQARSATVRAFGKARILTVDETTFLRYVHQDPSLAYQLLKLMSKRVRTLSAEVTQLTVNRLHEDNNMQINSPTQSI